MEKRIVINTPREWGSEPIIVESLDEGKTKVREVALIALDAMDAIQAQSSPRVPNYEAASAWLRRYITTVMPREVEPLLDVVVETRNTAPIGDGGRNPHLYTVADLEAEFSRKNAKEAAGSQSVTINLLGDMEPPIAPPEDGAPTAVDLFWQRIRQVVREDSRRLSGADGRRRHQDSGARGSPGAGMGGSERR